MSKMTYLKKGLRYMKRPLILASNSARRKELMEMIGVPFTVCPAEHEEPVDENTLLEIAIEKVSLAKAQDVAKRYPDALVLGSDTVVAIGGDVLGKPKDREDCVRMLKKLSGRTHTVVTGFAFVSAEETYVSSEKTEVTFAKLSKEEIERYADTEEPYDKAGAYAIQGKSAVFVKGIKGDVYTVIGLPLQRVYQYLHKKNYL